MESIDPYRQQEADPMVGKWSGTARLVQCLPILKCILSNQNHIGLKPEFDFQDGYSKKDIDEDDEAAG